MKDTMENIMRLTTSKNPSNLIKVSWKLSSVSRRQKFILKMWYVPHYATLEISSSNCRKGEFQSKAGHVGNKEAIIEMIKILLFLNNQEKLYKWESFYWKCPMTVAFEEELGLCNNICGETGVEILQTKKTKYLWCGHLALKRQQIYANKPIHPSNASSVVGISKKKIEKFLNDTKTNAKLSLNFSKIQRS